MTAADAVQVVQQTTEGVANTDSVSKKKRKNHRKTEPQKSTTIETPVIPLNDKVAEILRGKDAAIIFREDLLAVLAQPRQLALPSSISRPAHKPGTLPYAGPVTENTVTLHPHDAYRLLGELVLPFFEEWKVTKPTKKKTGFLQRFFPPDRPESISPNQKFHYKSVNKNAHSIDFKNVNLEQLPDVYPYADILAEKFSKNHIDLQTGKPLIRTEEVLMAVQELHYTSHVGNDPNKPKREFNVRGNDKSMDGYFSQGVLKSIRDNGVTISEDVPREIPNTDHKDAFFIVAGMAFEDRIRIKTGGSMKYTY